jgi:type IV pilus assembly protein PilA
MQYIMRNKQKGFSLIELLIVVAIILIIAAIAIPNLIRSRMAANEASAVAVIRTLNTSEVVYSATYGGFSANLKNLGPNTTTCTSTVIPTATAACLVDSVVGNDPSTKSGYTTTYGPGTAITGATAGQVADYTLTATPVAIGSTGQRGFFSDQSLVIRGDVTGKATVASAPI